MTEEFRKFLKSMYDRLYKEGIITKKASTSKEKLEIILAYIEKISKIQNKTEENKEYLRRIKELYYNRYIIKESEIPNSYFEHLSKRYLEEGNGDLNLVNPQTSLEKEVRRMHVEEIIHTEKSSIDVWLDYLMSSESDHIPSWAKVWAFTGMLDIGVMNRERGNFNRRRNGTIAPFANINSEILGKSVMYLKMHLKLMPDEFFPNEEIKRLASTESFYQIYGHLLAKATAIKPKSNEGMWVKYKGNSKEDALSLYNDLQGYNTGWCTAASKETAINQICGGDSYPGGNFYVYYSVNENNEYKIPRLAIRMNKDKIGEIRGIADNQNTEPEMEDVLNEKLKEFPDSEEYKKKVRDMKELTKIYNKNKQKEELTKEELRFLYEIDNKIDGFGYQKDPRIEEIAKGRNKRKDLAIALECLEEEIGIEPERIKGKHFKYYYGNLDLSYLISAKGLELPEIISGDLDLSSLTSAEGLEFPESIGGSLYLRSLTSAEGLEFPKNIGSNLYLDNLESAEGLKFPKNIGGNLYLMSLTSAKGLRLPESIGGNLYLKSLTSVEELKFPKNIGGNLYLDGLGSAEGLELPESIGGNLHLDNLESAEGLRLPESIVGSLYLYSLESAEGLELPKSVGGSLDLDGLTSAEGLELPESIGGSLYLDGLTSAEGLELPESIEYSLYLRSLTSVKGLVLPKNIGSNLYLNSLSIENLLEIELPISVAQIRLSDGDYSLEELKNLIAIRKEKLDLKAKKNIIQNSTSIVEENLKRGNINIWYILIPAFTLLLGIIIASILYY